VIKIRPELKKLGLIGTDLKRTAKDLRQWAMEDLGLHFHAENLPRRFTVAGGIYLGFQRRSHKYEARKIRRFGHRNPLVWSGASRTLALGIRDIRTKATPDKSEVRIVIHSRGLNRRNASTIRMADEVRMVSPREHGPLTKVVDQSISRNLKELEKRS
jgi:hypothetical protein